MSSTEQFHLQVNYIPKTDKMQWQNRFSGDAIVCSLDITEFAKLVEYLELVLASTTAYRKKVGL